MQKRVLKKGSKGSDAFRSWKLSLVSFAVIFTMVLESCLLVASNPVGVTPFTTRRPISSIQETGSAPAEPIDHFVCFTSRCGAEFYHCPDSCSYGYRQCSKARIETVCCCGVSE